MATKILRFEDTPNPNAVKCVLDQAVSQERRSYRSAQEAHKAQDALASALFELNGVESVLINGDWMTINKSAKAKWTAVKEGVRKALAEQG